MVVLMPGLQPFLQPSQRLPASSMFVHGDSYGFLDGELHDRTDATKSKVKEFTLRGCASPDGYAKEHDARRGGGWLWRWRHWSRDAGWKLIRSRLQW